MVRRCPEITKSPSSSRQIDEAAAKAAAEEQAKKKGVVGGYSMIPQDIEAEIPETGQDRHPTPMKYEAVSPENELKATVTSGSNTFDFDLKD